MEQEFEEFANNTYRDCIEGTGVEQNQEISSELHDRLIEFLNVFEIPDGFSDSIEHLIESRLIINSYINELLRDNLPETYHDRVSDLNSVVMGVPNNTDSDLDFTIAIKSIDEQDEVGDILQSLGFEYQGTLDEGIHQKYRGINWKYYIKYYEEVQIEVKLRDEDIVNDILIGHRGIRDYLTDEQKLKISYIKSVLCGKVYKTFKYILYGAMFNGHENAIIFRHYTENGYLLVVES